jgi:hypothetical protein
MTLRCSSCGATNVPDDQFCGTCGAALPAQASEAPYEAGSGVIDPEPPVLPAPPPETRAGPARECAVCGAQNAMARTFCRVCGSTLAQAGPTTGIPAGAPAATSAPSAAPASPGAAAGGAASGGAASRGAIRTAAGSRGGGGWLVALAVLGLLAGVMFVLIPSLLGSRPVTEAVPTRAAPTAAAPTEGLPEARQQNSSLLAGWDGGDAAMVNR